MEAVYTEASHDNTEPELPPLPSDTRTVPKFSRKRTIDEVLYNASSDPAIFSSDDPSLTVENYTSQRLKKSHTGTWWSSTRQDLDPDRSEYTGGTRNFTRNFDSGIWMDSDGSLPDDDDNTQTRSNLAPLGAPQTHPIQRMLGVRKSAVSLQEGSTELSLGQKVALQRIEMAVIKNNPSIDLSCLSLDSLPWEILKPLQTFTTEPKHHYQPFSSCLGMHLANNNLTELPPELYTLQGVTMLSLRGNKIKELSPAVARLAPHLQEMSIAFNDLHYLPMEIKMPVGRICLLTDIRISGNPFYQPIQRLSNLESSPKQLPLSDAIWLGRHTPDLSYSFPIPEMIVDAEEASICVSRIAYLNFQGSPVDCPVPSRDPRANPMMNTQSSSVPRIKSNVPSLYELALRSSTIYPLNQLLSLLEEDAPQILVNNLRSAAQQVKTGFQACSICKRPFSIARTEWIEWQADPGAEYKVPYLYRGCSWNCLPDVTHLAFEAQNCGWE